MIHELTIKITGPTGSGKTTLCQLIATLLGGSGSWKVVSTSTDPDTIQVEHIVTPFPEGDN